MENILLHERLLEAMVRAHMQLRKMREEGDPLYMERVSGIAGHVRFYADRNMADIRLDRSSEIASFQKQTQKDLIYILADESLWSEHKKTLTNKVMDLEDQLWISKRTDKEIVYPEQAYSYEMNSLYVFDERPSIILSDRQDAEKSIITRAIYMLDGVNPYENCYQLGDENFLKSTIKKINFELDKLIASFEGWHRKITFTRNKNKSYLLSSGHSEEDISLESAFLIAAVKETIDTFRLAKNIINNMSPIWLFKAGYVDLNNGHIGGIEKTKLISIWGKSVKAFDNEVSNINTAIKRERELGVKETQQIIRVEKEALDLNVWVTEKKSSFGKLIEINSAINFLESKQIKCNLEMNNFDKRAEEITYEPFKMRLSPSGISMSDIKRNEDIFMYDWFTKKIQIVGLGGASRVMMQVFEPKMSRFNRFIYADTDFKGLDDLMNFLNLKILKLGHNYTKGQGAKGMPEVGKAVVKKNTLLFKNSLPRSSKCIFILAGLGRGTGSGGASEVAKIGRESGIFTIAILTEPQDISPESGETAIANRSIREIREEAGGLILIPNEELEHYRSAPYEPLGNSYQTKTGIALETLSRLISGRYADAAPGIPIAFSDIESFFSGNTIVRLGSASGFLLDAQSVASQARDHLGVSLKLAKKILVCISGFRLEYSVGSDAEDIMVSFREYVDAVEDIVKMGSAGGVKIITGFDNCARSDAPVNESCPLSAEDQIKIKESNEVRITIFAAFDGIVETAALFNDITEQPSDLEIEKQKELVRV